MVELVSERHSNVRGEKVFNYIGVSTVTFCHGESEEVEMMVDLEVSEYFGEDRVERGRKVLICNLLHLESTIPFNSSQYRIFI